MAIKNLVITPVTIGRISIGKRVESNGKQLPQKDDEFHITSNIQQNGQWVIPKGVEEVKNEAGGKLRSIPVRILFDTPDNNFRSGYACFNNDGRQVCAGNGEKASRITAQGREEVECPGHEFCKFGQANRCKPYARLLIALESIFEKDPLAAFAFRTTGYNSVNALTSRFTQFHALTGGKMSGMSCNLVLRAKSTAKSRRQAIYYVDIEPRGSLFEAVTSAQDWHKRCSEQSLNLEALDQAVSAGFAAAPYIDSGDAIEADGVVDEFYSEEAQAVLAQQQEAISDDASMPSAGLTEILSRLTKLVDLKAEAAVRTWINNRRDLSEFEKKQALQALEVRLSEICASLPNAA
jgi:hypothetical protein